MSTSVILNTQHQQFLWPSNCWPSRTSQAIKIDQERVSSVERLARVKGALSFSLCEVVNMERASNVAAQYSVSNLANGCSYPVFWKQAVLEAPWGAVIERKRMLHLPLMNASD